jgi:hypothetical protein
VHCRKLPFAQGFAPMTDSAQSGMKTGEINRSHALKLQPK